MISTRIFFLFYSTNTGISVVNNLILYKRHQSLMVFNIGIKDVFECFMMDLNYRAAILKPRSPKG